MRLVTLSGSAGKRAYKINLSDYFFGCPIALTEASKDF